jgi:hypothetical protein
MTTLLLTDPTNPRYILHERSRTRARLSARLRSQDLDRALAAGVSPDSGAALSLRAQALLGVKARSALARSIHRLIDDALHPVAVVTPRIPTCRRKILRSRSSLEALAARLVRGDPVDVHGVARVAVLLADCCGPLYDRPTADDLEPAVQRALEALEL